MEKGERGWVKWRFKSKQGIRNLRPQDAKALSSTDPDYAQRDLCHAIERGEFPRWRVCVQVMTDTDTASCRWNPFDLTTIWPHKDYPLIEVGEMEPNRNPENHFAEVEQAALSPSNSSSRTSSASTNGSPRVSRRSSVRRPARHRYPSGSTLAA